MSFDEEVSQASQEMGSSSDFYKLQGGDNRVHILTEPKIEVSRYGYGVCYEGAPYCTEAALDEDYRHKLAEAAREGRDTKDIKKPKLTKTWMCWAILLGEKNQFVILTLNWNIAKQLTDIKRAEETKFEGWPMPYRINIVATDSGKKFNGKTVYDYKILTDRKDTSITAEEMALLEAKTPIENIIDKKKEKARGSSAAPKTASKVEEEVGDGEIPF